MNSIRQVFGNHREYVLFMNLITHVNDPDIIELPKPVLSRHVNGHNANFINDTNKHNRIMRRLATELTIKYSQYQMN